MSLPSIFTPVKTGSMVLVDGGVLENIPVEAVRNMGANVVIAVALETNRPNPDQIKSLADGMVMTQRSQVILDQPKLRKLRNLL